MIIYLGGGYGSHMCRTEPEVVTPTVPDLSPVLPYRVPRDLGFLTLSFPSPGAPTVPGELVHPPPSSSSTDPYFQSPIFPCLFFPK